MLNEAREITERWLNEYNSERPHESLNNLTPEEYRLMAEKPEISKSVWNKAGILTRGLKVRGLGTLIDYCSHLNSASSFLNNILILQVSVFYT